jgi:anti-sigma factor RsiW
VGNPGHLEFEVLSALADGELELTVRANAIEHLVGCRSCTRTLEAIGALDAQLRKPTPITCEGALLLLSAALDKEADTAELAVARAHAATCAHCAQSVMTWSSLDMQLRALPHGAPSRRVDLAVAALGRAPQRVGLRLGIPRLAVAGMTALLLLIGSLYRGAPGGIPAATSNDQVFVAAVQEVVFNTRTNTLYVLDASAGAVDARDATTNEVKVRIDVGGRPTALALNESANTLIVLDSSQKKLTEIDTNANRVISSTTVAVTGTPTAISVDPNSSKIVVSSGGQSSTPGSVSVIDSATKKVESVREFTTSPQAMVFSPAGDRAVVVSEDATTLLDSSYKAIATLPGGVAAAFAQGDDRLAIISASAKGTAITYVGAQAPAAIDVEGKPRAIVSLPDGGFLVLVDVGDHSRVSYVVPDGHVAGSIDLPGKGRGLVYDSASHRFSVAVAGQVTWASVPQTVITAAASPSPTFTAPSTAAPTASGSGSASPDASPTAGPSATPSASVAPSGTPSASTTPKPIETATAVAKDFVHLDLAGNRAPYAVSQSGERVWVLDDKNGIQVIDLATGDVKFVSSLPRSALISQFVAGRGYLFALDERHGELYSSPLFSPESPSVGLRLPKTVTSVAVGLDDSLWMGLADSSLLLRFDPRTKQTLVYDLNGAKVSKLATDPLGRVFYADDSRNAVGLLDPATGSTSELAFPRRGITTGLAVDGSSSLWVGTSDGEIWRVRGGTYSLTIRLERPVTTISVDADGRAWFLAPLPSAGPLSFTYGAADGSRAGQTISGPAFTLSFGARGRAWLADPRGGFWVSAEVQ